MPNWICSLTPAQARKAELCGILPDCRNVNPESDKSGCHPHIKAKEAEKLVGAGDGTGDARWVGGFRMIAMNIKRGWSSVKSGSISTLQLTRCASRSQPANKPEFAR